MNRCRAESWEKTRTCIPITLATKNIIMKKAIIAAFVLMACYSCAKTDNYASPNATFQGNLIDSVTGQNLLTETGGAQLMLKQLSWSATPDPYYIPTKPDGSFEDTRIFSGNYSVIPTQGAFWPTDSIVKQIS